MNDEIIYYLMHKNEVVTVLTIERISGSIVKVSNNVKKELLPLGGKHSQSDLKKWWERRAVPLSQGNMERILINHNIPTTTNFLLRNLGLSLTDHYWIKPIDSGLEWENVSLYTNDFKDEIGELQLKEQFDAAENVQDEVEVANKSVFYPSASLQGELQKKWIIKKGERYLIKGNYGDSCQQSINEVIATYVHQEQKRVPYTSYRLCEITTIAGKGMGCICKDFTSEAIEFISAYDVVSSIKKRNDMSEYEHFIFVCKENGLDENVVRTFLEYQILTDFVLTNTDRHFNNFGILRNSDTLKFIDVAPIFDSGNSMFWNMPKLPLNNDLLDIQVSSFRKKEKDLLKYVSDVNLVDIEKLPSQEAISNLLKKDVYYESRIKGVVAGYEKKIELLYKLQHGDKIFSYGQG